MKIASFRWFLAIFASLSLAAGALAGDQTAAQGLSILDEKVSRLTAQVEDLQFRNQQLQKDVEKIQSDIQELRRAAGGGTISTTDLKALDDRIQAVDEARKKDRQAIIDQLAKELAGMSSGKSPGKSAPVVEGKEHVVAKGEYLATIARKYGVSIADLKKANNLTSDDLKVGQKLTIPK